MRKWVLGLVVGMSLSGLVWAQGTEIEGVIANQIEAFKADDFPTAFTFASPGIRGLFGTPENFGRMVTQGYPMVWRPAEVDFLELSDEGGRLRQRVRIVDGDGAVHILDYFMLETGDGWKINGVNLVKNEGLSA